MKGRSLYKVCRSPLPFFSPHHLLTPNREAPDSSFDWFKSYKDIAHLITPEIRDKNARVLMLGCGNSTLSEEV